jgi:2-aminoadipate transaminase
MGFDMTSRFRPGLPRADAPAGPAPRFSFVGGHNDAASVPFGGLAEAAVQALRREGRSLATYNLGGSPLGYQPLRRFVAGALERRAGMVTDPEEVLVTSGSLQALDLVNSLFVAPGDTVLVEQASYGGMLTRLARLGARVVGVDLDEDGMVVDHLAATLARLEAAGTPPRFLYTIPTVQNPTGSALPEERRLAVLELCRRYGVPIFEDDCYADLLWDGVRPPTLRALDQGGGQVIYCGSFSKSIAPALRVGYLVADGPVRDQLLALKTDAGSGALEQLVLAEFAPAHFDAHVGHLREVLRAKAAVMAEAVSASFGGAAHYAVPKGGIFLWLTLPEGTDTAALAGPAAAAGIEFNPGAGWSADPVWGARRLRLCFGHPDHGTIRAGVAALAEVYERWSAP